MDYEKVVREWMNRSPTPEEVDAVLSFFKTLDQHKTDAYVKECTCGKKILMVRDQNGATVPLDPSAPVYVVTRGEKDADALTTMRATLLPKSKKGRTSFMVSHFATCTDASRHSKK